MGFWLTMSIREYIDKNSTPPPKPPPVLNNYSEISCHKGLICTLQALTLFICLGGGGALSNFKWVGVAK